MKEITKGYALWLIESVRVKLGYDINDSSHDKEVIKYLQSGEKLSKSKHMINYQEQDKENNL